MPGFAQRMGRVEFAASVQMTIKARDLQAAGKPVITLTTGEPDFDSPPQAIEAAHQAALLGDTKYPPQDGTRALKQAIQRKFRRDSTWSMRLTRSPSRTAGNSAFSMR